MRRNDCATLEVRRAWRLVAVGSASAVSLPRTALLAIAFVIGCTREPTQLVVVLDSDLAVPSELDALQVHVEGRGVEESRGPFSLEGIGREELPVSFGVAPEGRDAGRSVTVRLSGWLDGVERLSTFARTGFVAHERLRLDLFLARRCLTDAPECAPGQTCGEDGCEDPYRDPKSLPRWDGHLERPEDAGTPEGDGGDGGDCVVEEGGAGILAWSRAPSEGATATAAASFPAGGGSVVGTFEGPVSFGDGTCQAAPSAGVYAARLEQDGTLSWLRTFGGPGVVATSPRVAVDLSDGDAAFLAFGLPEGSLTLAGAEYGDGQDGLVVRVDGAGIVTQVAEVRTDGRWNVAELVTDAAHVALVGTGRGHLEVVGDGQIVTDLDDDLAVAIRWTSGLGDPCLAVFPASGGTEATTAAFFADGLLGVSGQWWGTLDLDGVRYEPFGDEAHFTMAIGEACGSPWDRPAVETAANVAQRNLGFGTDASLLLFVRQQPSGYLTAIALTESGSPGPIQNLQLDATQRVTFLDRAGDAGGVYGGEVLDADPPAGWISRFDALLLPVYPATRLEILPDALSVDATAETMLLAGSLEGTTTVDGSTLGTDGRRQVYAVRIPLP